MFKEVRKIKNRISNDKALDLLKKSRRGVLALYGLEGYPYAIPINYFYDEEKNKIYFHGAISGHKVDAIKADNHVCFTVYGNETIKEEAWAPFLMSTIVFGRCHLLDNSLDSLEILKKFAMKYYPSELEAMEEINRAGRAAQIFEIEIDHISGKEIQEK